MTSWGVDGKSFQALPGERWGPQQRNLRSALGNFLRAVLSSTCKGLFYSAAEKIMSRVESLKFFYTHM